MDFEIYDSTIVAYLDEGDQITFSTDEGQEYLAVTSLVDNDETFLVTGHSYVTNETVSHTLDATSEVDLWTA